jgi:hypothetical protein
VSPDFRSPAESSEVFLQAGIHRGVPVAIPGAREPRVGGPAVALAIDAGAGVAAAANVEARQQAEYEREGGGAPSERRGTARRTVMTRVLDWLRRAS